MKWKNTRQLSGSAVWRVGIFKQGMDGVLWHCLIMLPHQEISPPLGKMDLSSGRKNKIWVDTDSQKEEAPTNQESILGIYIRRQVEFLQTLRRCALHSWRPRLLLHSASNSIESRGDDAGRFEQKSHISKPMKCIHSLGKNQSLETNRPK